jgi:tRNA-Thr(GGU) m(6)t(6)A37 methyltransferase TsaA
MLGSGMWWQARSPPHPARARTRHPAPVCIRLVSKASRQARRAASWPRWNPTGTFLLRRPGTGRAAARPERSIRASPWAVPAAGEQTVLVQTSYGLVPIGWVQSALRVLDDAPNQREGAPQAWIRFDEQVAEGAKDLRPGDEIVVLTWLHLSPRDELSTHPEDDMRQSLTGVFSTCSPNRPNPIGLHRARIVARDGLRIEVDALEAIDGTPVVDVKPAIDAPA